MTTPPTLDHSNSACPRLNRVQSHSSRSSSTSDPQMATGYQACTDTGTCPCEPAESMLRRRIGEIDSEIARLTALRTDLVAMADALPSTDCPDPSPDT